MKTRTLRYEDAAEQRIITTLAWVCLECNTAYADKSKSGVIERMARNCCAKDRPCEGCPTGRIAINDAYTICDDCKTKERQARWDAFPKVEWDGETPLCVWDNDKYFFDVEDLGEYLYDNEMSLGELKLVMCQRVKPRQFDVLDYLDPSEMPDDFEPEPTEMVAVESLVMDYLKKLVSNVWEPYGDAVTTESVAKYLRMEDRN